MKSNSKYSYETVTVVLLISALTFLSGCVEEPVKEDVPELVTKLTLIFTPLDGGDAVSVSAMDPDGEGVQDITANDSIVLIPGKSYSLTLSLINELADPTSPEYDITAEVKEEGDEHLFFFAWTNNLFSSPSGNGNIDSRADAIVYSDLDAAGNPIGLKTAWATGSTLGTGTFRVLLKHQPGIKSTTSNSTDGETDLDVTFDIEVKW